MQDHLNEIERNFLMAIKFLRENESKEDPSIDFAKRELFSAMQKLTIALLSKAKCFKELPPEYQKMAVNSFDEFLDIGVPFNLTELRSSNRKQFLVMQRKHISIFLRNKGYSFHQIGNFLNRSHCTIVHLTKHAPWDHSWMHRIELDTSAV